VGSIWVAAAVVWAILTRVRQVSAAGYLVVVVKEPYEIGFVAIGEPAKGREVLQWSEVAALTSTSLPRGLRLAEQLLSKPMSGRMAPQVTPH
jgi:hypothetical protein